MFRLDLGKRRIYCRTARRCSLARETRLISPEHRQARAPRVLFCFFEGTFHHFHHVRRSTTCHCLSTGRLIVFLLAGTLKGYSLRMPPNLRAPNGDSPAQSPDRIVAPILLVGQRGCAWLVPCTGGRATPWSFFCFRMSGATILFARGRALRPIYSNSFLV